MGAVTYPDSRVSRLIDENFIPVQINVAEDSPQVSEAIDRYRQIWTPTVIVLDPEGKEVRRSQGYFPPEEFLPELLLGLGQAQMLDRNYSRAYQLFERITKEHESSAACAEATYWMGVNAYKRDDDPDKLTEHWNRLKERYPDSPWWQKASFIAE